MCLSGVEKEEETGRHYRRRHVIALMINLVFPMHHYTMQSVEFISFN